MRRAIVLGGLIAWAILSVATGASGQAGDIQATEQAYYDRVVSLRTQIALGWIPAQVTAIMGVPDRMGTRLDGTQVVEVWGYRGYEVLIEFRNGLVSNWFFRFME